VFPIYLYLISLIIAPQLWVSPIVGLPTDYILYPMLMFAVIATGQLQKFFRFDAYDALLGAFVVVVAFGAVLNGLTDLSEEQIVLYVKFFVLYKLVTALVFDMDRAQQFIRFFKILVLVLAIGAIQQKVSLDGSGWANQGRAWIDPDVISQGGVGRSRWIGIFDGPGVFCVLFSVALPFSLRGMSKHFTFRQRLTSAIATGLILGATYCTGSRGGLLAALAVMGLYVLLKRRVSIRSIMISSLLIVGLYLSVPSYLTTINDQSNSTQYRVEMWAAGLDMIKGQPLLGIGRGNFAAYTNKLIAHNSAVQIGGETGLAGLFLWIALVYISFKGVLAKLNSTTDLQESSFCIALIMSLIGYLVSAMFVTLEYETFYLLLALCAAVARTAAVPISFGTRDAINVAAIQVLWLIVLQAFVISYLG
jgi:O-antigen ligase